MDFHNFQKKFGKIWIFTIAIKKLEKLCSGAGHKNYGKIMKIWPGKVIIYPYFLKILKFHNLSIFFWKFWNSIFFPYFFWTFFHNFHKKFGKIMEFHNFIIYFEILDFIISIKNVGKFGFHNFQKIFGKLWTHSRFARGGGGGFSTESSRG